MRAVILWWTLYYCGIYKVDPAFALAVAYVESRTAHQEFRVGLLCNRWYGPFNIHKDFARRWPEIMTVQGNCKRGVMALRGKDKRRVLKRYNAAFTEAYYRAVLAAQRRYRLKGTLHAD